MSDEVRVRRRAYLYLLSALGAGTFAALWAWYYREKPTGSTTGPLPFAQSEDQLLTELLTGGSIDLEEQRALKQIRDYRKLTERVGARIEWEYLSEIGWHLDHLDRVLERFA